MSKNSWLLQVAQTFQESQSVYHSVLRYFVFILGLCYMDMKLQIQLTR